ncbi:MAG: CZB domain-containing protein [Bdellovibrionales bacterium]|jgi:hypothetical protein|nr:CZB domain-containing protein [Bdellovibrionales bacterium]MBT3525531.1 CZB domain-containing protein [Bdellovibrionales bacterium]MBT7670311.1 CZB domain-containing protein [Bdellovibrionales bacterium]MBT7768010.1 CZB domain-containing protein [Bdellovibrionales bacterium]
MKMNVCLDANVARLVHIDWTEKLELMVKQGLDRTTLDDDSIGISPLLGHEDCDLGKWLYGKALRHYNYSRVVWPLSDVHQKFHRVAQHMLEERKRLLTPGHDQSAAERIDIKEGIEQSLVEIHVLSREIIYLLTSMELDILESDKPSFISNSIRVLKMLVTPEPQTPKHEDIPTFCESSNIEGKKGEHVHKNYIEKINQTRLTHVEWVIDLQNAFRNYGRTVKLQPAEQCNLGLWIHNEGHEFLSQHTEISMLDQLHKDFHHAADETVSSLRSGRFQGSEESYHSALSLSKDIILLLTKVEYLYEGQDNLLKRMGGGVQNGQTSEVCDQS